MPPIQLVLLDLPLLTAELIALLLADERDIEVLAASSDPPDDWLARAFRSDVIVVEDGEFAPRTVHRLLAAEPWVKVLVATDRGHCTVLYELRLRAERLGELSRESLQTSIAAARASRRTWQV